MENLHQEKERIIVSAKKVHWNLSPAKLVTEALSRGEGALTSTGAFRVLTGKHTGRSPYDKYVVKSKNVATELDWVCNQAISEEAFQALYLRMEAYLKNREIFVFDGLAGAEQASQLKVRFINEFAWQNLFVHQLFIRPEETAAEADSDFTVLCAPGFAAIPSVDGTRSETFIMIHFERRLVLIGGTSYAGEMKKSIFTVMNYLLPKAGILSMHCSANVGEAGDTALFFGLSGTGKTTLSADPARRLIGDDEHGWSEQGIFNVEGGCYAKCIHLSQAGEPQIWSAIKFGTVLENVAIDETNRTADYDSAIHTENTRAAYPIDAIPNALLAGQGRHPKTVIFLTADAFGILPPVAKLTPEQAMYHFLSGYTSKLAGTEKGVTEPEATFSACFGAPFLPLSPLVYANRLKEKLTAHNTNVYLINTGWSGGPAGVGKRMNLAFTRAMVTAALDGSLAQAEYRQDPLFQLFVPTTCPDVPDAVLQPRSTWQDPAEYDMTALQLAKRFIRNMEKFGDQIPEEVLQAGPVIDGVK